MNNSTYARLHDALNRDEVDTVAAELLTLPRNDVADFFVFFVSQSCPFRASKCVRHMKAMEIQVGIADAIGDPEPSETQRES